MATIDLSSDIKNGVTLTRELGEIIREIDRSVACGIEVENWTKYQLSDPSCYLNHGEAKGGVHAVAPGYREAMVTYKGPFTLFGSEGVMSWLVAEKRCRVVVMWSVPHQRLFRNNWLAVGITDTGFTAASNHDWFDLMYGSKKDRGNGFDLIYVRAKYNNDLQHIRCSRNGLIIEGTMGSDLKCKAKVIVRPEVEEDVKEYVPHLQSRVAAPVEHQ